MARTSGHTRPSLLCVLTPARLTAQYDRANPRPNNGSIVDDLLDEIAQVIAKRGVGRDDEIEIGWAHTLLLARKAD